MVLSACIWAINALLQSLLAKTQIPAGMALAEQDFASTMAWYSQFYVPPKIGDTGLHETQRKHSRSLTCPCGRSEQILGYEASTLVQFSHPQVYPTFKDLCYTCRKFWVSFLGPYFQIIDQDKVDYFFFCRRRAKVTCIRGLLRPAIHLEATLQRSLLLH